MAVGRQSTSVIKVGVTYMGIHVLRCLNEELTWIIDKELQAISNFKLNNYTTKELLIKAITVFADHCTVFSIQYT